MSQKNTLLTPSTLPRTAATEVAVPEPGPDWPVAKQTWGFAWHLHWIGFGCAYALLALNSAIVITRYRRTLSLAGRVLFNSVNSLLILLGVTRALYLFIDPYESGENLYKCPVWLVRPLFGLAFPCLTSSFSLLHIAFVEAVKLQLGPKKLQNVRFVSSVIVLHFVIVIVSDTTVAIHANRTELLIVCQSFFILWGIWNSAAFLYSGSRIILRERAIQRNLKLNSGNKHSGARDWKTKISKVTIGTSILALSCTGLQTYSLFGVYGIYSKVVNPQPWPWWAFQTSFRLVELGLAYTIAYTVLQPAAKSQKCFFHFYNCNLNKRIDCLVNDAQAVKTAWNKDHELK